MSDKKMVTLKIDGIEVSIEDGKKVYDAAMKAGVYLPGLCYDPKLTRFGGCRLCVVDVTARGRTRAKWACCEPAKDGIEVTTNTEKIRKKQQIMMEFLLAAHPLDCPTCNASGSCGLQDATYFIKQKKGRIPLKRRDEHLLIDNPVLERDYNKCIMCGKCVVICDEVQGNGAIGFQKRGYWAEVGTPFRVPLECDYCGQCLHVCPTGSFQDHTELYKGHSWEYKKTMTVCPYCAVGCAIVINEKRGELVKVTSNDWVGVNNGNLCARGRFGHGAVQAGDRLKTPLVRRETRQEEAGWQEAIGAVADRLRETVEKHGPESVAVIAGETLTNEDAYVLQKLMRSGLGVNRLATLSGMRSPELNAGLFDQFGGSAPVADYEGIKDAGSFLFVGCDAATENPVIANMIRVAMRDNNTPLFVANARKPEFLPSEQVRLTHKYGSEALLLSGLIRKVSEAGAKADNAGELTKTAMSVSMDAVTAATGLSEEEIGQMASGLAAAGRPMIFLGKEAHDHPMAADVVKAAVNLANLLGGKVTLFREYCNSQGLNDMGFSSTHLPGYRPAGDEAARKHYSSMWGCDLSGLTVEAEDIFTALSEGKIKALVIAGADPITQYADGQFVREAIQQAGFIAVTTSFETPTSQLADVVLPACSAAERDGTYTNNEGRVQLVRKAVEIVGQSRPEWEIWQDVAVRLDVKFDYDECAGIAEEIADCVQGYKGLTHGRAAWGGALVEYPGAGGAATAHEYRAEAPEVKDDPAFPFAAVIGNSLYHLGTASRHSKALNEIEPRAYVEISPAAAEARGLSDGDEAIVESRQGSIKAKVKTTWKSSDDVVFVSKNFEETPATYLIYRNDAVTRVNVKKAGAD